MRTDSGAPHSIKQLIAERAAKREQTFATECEQKARYLLLKPAFPHIRHDPELFAALWSHLTQQGAAVDCKAACQLRSDLETSLAGETKAPPKLTELFSHYLVMEKKATAKEGTKAWRKNPDHFLNMVQAQRGDTTQRESIAFS